MASFAATELGHLLPSLSRSSRISRLAPPHPENSPRTLVSFSSSIRGTSRHLRLSITSISTWSIYLDFGSCSAVRRLGLRENWSGAGRGSRGHQASDGIVDENRRHAIRSREFFYRSHFLFEIAGSVNGFFNLIFLWG